MNVRTIKPELQSARRYLGVAYERCANGYPADSDKYQAQQSIINTFVMKRPNSAPVLVFVAFVGAVISRPLDTGTNLIRSFKEWLIN